MRAISRMEGGDRAVPGRRARGVDSLLSAVALVGFLCGAPVAAELTISGRVSACEGEPLPHAEVELHAALGSYEAALHSLRGDPVTKSHQVGVTGEDGRFELTAPEVGLWTVRVHHPDYPAVTTVPMPVTDAVTLSDLCLTRRERAELRLVDPSGVAVAGARVGVFGRGEARSDPIATVWLTALRWAWSDEAGRVVLETHRDEHWIGWAFGASGHAVVRGGAGELRHEPLVLGGELRSLRLVDDRGRPVPRAIVLIAPLWLAAAQADDDGRLTLPWPDEGARLLSVVTPGGVHGAPRLREEDGGALLEVSSLENVAVVVREEVARTGLSDAVVWVPELQLSGRTGRRGELSLALPRDRQLSVFAFAPGYTGSSEYWSARPGEEVVIVLAPTGALAGLVVDPAGEPLGEVELTLEVDPASSFSPPREELLRATSDVDGRFELRGIAPRATYRLTARKAGFAPLSVTPPVLDPAWPAREALVLELRRGSAIAGRLVDAAGAPVAGGEIVLLADKHQLLEEGRPGVVDAAGTFRFEDVAGGAHLLWASAPGFLELWSTVEVGSDGGPLDAGDVVLERGRRLAGRVVDETGQPVTHAMISVLALDPSAWPPAPSGASPTTDAAGAFSVDAAPTGRLSLTIYGEGRGELTLEAGEQDRDDLVIVTRSAVEVRGRVVGPDGRPIPGARLRFEHRLVRLRGSGGSSTTGTNAEEDGSFRFTLDGDGGTVHLSAGTVGLYGELPRLRVPDDLGEELVLALQPAAILRGSVLDSAGAPVARAQIEAQHLVEGGTEELSADASSVATDAEGRYGFPFLPPGSYRMVARHPDLSAAERRLELVAGENELSFELESGSSRRVRGRVLDGEGRPVEGAKIWIVHGSSASSGSDRTYADGSFDLVLPEPGEHRLEFRRQGLAAARSAPFEVGGPEPVELLITMTPGAAVVGTLRGVEPSELAGFTFAASGPPWRRAEGYALPDGRFKIPHLTPGEWTVWASGPRGSRHRAVEVPAGGEVAVELRFDEGYTVTGEILFDGAPLDGAEVTSYCRPGPLNGRDRTDSDGRFRIAGAEGSCRFEVVDPRNESRYGRDEQIRGDTHLVIELASGAIAGQVLDGATRSPLPGATVSLIDDRNSWPTAEVRADAEGRFRLERVPTGRRRLVVGHPGYGLAIALVEVSGSPSETVVPLELEAQLLLRPLTSSGTPPPRVWIALYGDNDQPIDRRQYAVGADGTVRVERLAPGRWKLRIDGASESATVEVTAPGAATVTLAPQRVGGWNR